MRSCRSRSPGRQARSPRAALARWHGGHWRLGAGRCGGLHPGPPARRCGLSPARSAPPPPAPPPLQGRSSRPPCHTETSADTSLKASPPLHSTPPAPLCLHKHQRMSQTEAIGGGGVRSGGTARTPGLGHRSGKLERSPRSNIPSERLVAWETPECFPPMQGLSTRNPCRGAQGTECGAAAYTLKAALKAPDSSQITKKLCRSWLHLGIPAVPSSFRHPPFQSLEPVSPSPIPLSQPWCRTHLALEQFLPPCPHHSPPKPPSTTHYCASPSLHCSPAFSFPPSCSSCHNLFGFAQMNVPAEYHRGMASPELHPLQPCSFLH